jgi:methionyl-tRNA formyltransferase
LNIVFFGTSEFAEASLKELLGSGHKVLAVVTQPDRKKVRSLKLSVSPVKALALSDNIRIYQPENASSRDSAEWLKNLGADIFVVVAFGQILKKDILDIPEYGAINIHGSLLPKYRGAAPTNWAIINGDGSSGVTIIRMNERMDEGDIILKKEIPIQKDDTNITLSEKLSDIGAKAAIEALCLIEQKKASFLKQDKSLATSAPKLKKEDGNINWSEDALTIHNKVRGFIPWPGAYTALEGKVLKIWKTELSDIVPPAEMKNGEIIDLIKDKGIIVKTGSGALAVTYLQLEGKKILDSDAFARGHKIGMGSIFSMK